MNQSGRLMFQKMFEFVFRLDRENAEELNEYLALHDAKVQKKMLTLSIAVAAFLVAASLLIFKLTSTGAIAAIVCVLLTMLLFPKLYWRVVFSRIEKLISSRDIKFTDTQIHFSDKMYITDGGKSSSVELHDIMAFDFTKNNCLIFYKKGGARNTVVIPNKIIGDQIAEFCTYLKEVTNNG